MIARTVPTTPARMVLVVVVVVVAVVLVAILTGWADDKAPPGSGGRTPVSAPATTGSR
jgi:hypothetical protein